MPRLLVRGQAAGLNDGSSWGDALTNLATALALAKPGTEIWVAAGAYRPGPDRANSFICPAGVRVYGGFNGTASARAQRDWQTNASVLSGDIGAAGDITDNCYHVVTGANGAQLDGFTITGGCANGLSSGNRDQVGGGIFADAGVTNFLADHCSLADTVPSRGRRPSARVAGSERQRPPTFLPCSTAMNGHWVWSSAFRRGGVRHSVVLGSPNTWPAEAGTPNLSRGVRARQVWSSAFRRL